MGDIIVPKYEWGGSFKLKRVNVRKQMGTEI